MKRTPINKIIPSSTVDGPGNRTSIFLQGCNIQCAYCHNPETQNLCCHCGICVDGCKAKALSIVDFQVMWDEDKCILCDNCIQVCPYNAYPRIKNMTAGEVFAKVRKNIPFIRGITVSGGEATLYPDFLSELFALAKTENLSCLIDSNGMVDLSDFPQLLENCDGVMLDVKAWDPEVYKKLTGSDNSAVKKNLKYLSEIGKLQELRIVCTPGEVDEEDIIQGIADRIGDQVEGIKLKLIRFRKYGVRGRLENKQSPDDAYMNHLRDLAYHTGFRNIVIL